MSQVKPTPPTLLHRPIVWGQKLRCWLGRSRSLWIALLAAVLLSGCVRYDVGVTFDSQTHGAIVQQINLSERLTNFSNATVQEWLDSIDGRARNLRGKTKRISDRVLVVTIPFHSGPELEEKFNQFFNPPEAKSQNDVPELEGELPQLSSHLSLNQNNCLFALRNRLSLDLDLRSLGVLSDNGSVILSSGSLLELVFKLNTPWGATGVVRAGDDLAPATMAGDGQLVWTLKPGQLNHLEAVFWVPSPIGLGAAVIILLMVAGHYLKHRLFPALGWERKPKAKGRRKGLRLQQ